MYNRKNISLLVLSVLFSIVANVPPAMHAGVEVPPPATEEVPPLQIK